MGMDIFEIIEGGFFTTVQDLGRYGYQRYGVPVSGAMDLFALRAANLLMGNSSSAAALEITLTGPRIRLLAETVVAVTGADLQPQLDGRRAPSWHPFVAPQGAILSFDGARDGLRAYLAVAGGIDVPVVLGSRSTFARGNLGGFDGRSVQAGDRVRAGQGARSRVEGRTFPVGLIPSYGHDHPLRVLPGPQHDAFSREGFATFLSSTFVVTSKSDRVGCRLDGPRVAHRGTADIVSDGIPFGAVQVAGDGLPMILLADRGTTGGYTKVATVISADLPRLAQALPGDRVSFREVSLADAHHALRHQEATLDAVTRAVPVVFRQGHMRVTVGGRACAVDVGLVEQGREYSGERVQSTTEITHHGRASTVEYEIDDVGEH
jgi:antagonist of KipI